MSFIESHLLPTKSTTFLAFAKKKSCPPVWTIPLLAYVIKAMDKIVIEVLCAVSVLQEDEELGCLAAGCSSGGV